MPRPSLPLVERLRHGLASAVLSAAAVAAPAAEAAVPPQPKPPQGKPLRAAAVEPMKGAAGLPADGDAIAVDSIRPLPPPMAACNATGATAPWAAPLSSTGAKAG